MHRGCVGAGEEALLAGVEREAPLRQCSYRAVGGCTLWALVVAELQPLLRTFPELRDRLSAAVHDRSVLTLISCLGRKLNLWQWRVVGSGCEAQPPLPLPHRKLPVQAETSSRASPPVASIAAMGCGAPPCWRLVPLSRPGVVPKMAGMDTLPRLEPDWLPVAGNCAGTAGKDVLLRLEPD